MISTACAIAAVFGAPGPSPQQSVFPQTTPYVYMLRWIYTLAPGASDPRIPAPALRPHPKSDSPGALPVSDSSARGSGYRAAWGMLSWGRDLRQSGWTTSAQKIVRALADSRALQTESDPNEADRGALYAVRILQDFPSLEAGPAIRADLAGWLGVAVERRGSSASVHRAIAAWAGTDSRLSKVLAALPSPSSGDAFERGSLSLDRWAAGQGSIDRPLMKAVGESPRTEDLPTAFGAAAALGDRAAFQRAAAALRKLSGLVNTQPNEQNGLEFGDLAVGRLGVVRNGSPMRHEGFLLAEGQFAATLYEVQKQFGGIFTSREGWTEGIDGVVLHRGQVMSLLGSNPVPFIGVFTLDWVKEGQGRVKVTDPPSFPAIRRLELVRRGSRVFVSAVPTFIASGANRVALAGAFIIGGKRVAASLGLSGFEAELPETTAGSWEVSFQGTAGEDRLVAERQKLWRVTPPLSEWKLTGGAGTSSARISIQGHGSAVSPAFYLEDGLLRFEGNLPAGASLRLLRGYEPEITANVAGRDGGGSWIINARAYRGEVVRIQVTSTLPSAQVSLRMRRS